MSEFKFACPVCGQHITADSSNSGGQLDCPTCFQKIVIPQAPSSPDAKFILSASQVGKPRPTGHGTETSLVMPSKSHGSRVAAIAFVVALCGAGAAAFMLRDKIFKAASHEEAPTNQTPKLALSPTKTYSIPTNIPWTLDLTNAVIPDTNAVGSIHGSGFFCEKAILQGGNLTLRQGRSGPADLGVTVQFFAQQGEELSGKTVEIGSGRTPPLPKVILRWKDDQEKAVTRSLTAGYALKVIFDEATNGRMPGKIYICLPDDNKSFVAGSFEAEIRKPAPPKPRQPKMKA